MTNFRPPWPPDQSERQQALDPSRSILVQAPAGSGKTDLLTRRFLRLLATVDDPAQIVAITFTIAAAAEMRYRVLSELDRAAASSDGDHSSSSLEDSDEFSMSTLARRALLHSQTRGWNLLELPSQLRISTIDSFCRNLALQQPLLSGLGSGLGIAEQPKELYRRAARQTLQQIGRSSDQNLGDAIESLLLWRDNNWKELEDLIVEMLCNRDRWMHDFLLQHEPDWNQLRSRLERPFAIAVREALTGLSILLDEVPQAREQILRLARFACSQTESLLHRELAELVELPTSPFLNAEDLEQAHQAFNCLANLLLTGDSAFRKAVDKRLGFPADRKPEKAQFLALIASLSVVPGLESNLAELRALPPTRYSEEEWQIIRACFTVLRRAAAELKLVFAESGTVDFIEVAQIAQTVLKAADGFPFDAAIALADGIRHLLVDEFQDTSRRQHQLLAGLIAAWPQLDSGTAGRTCFLVGDPMQSIYFFRDADAELFPRVRDLGLEIADSDPLSFQFVPLKANFRSAPPLVERLNRIFEAVFRAGDGSNVTFFPSQPFRDNEPISEPAACMTLHLEFVSQSTSAQFGGAGSGREREEAAETNAAACADQVNQIVDLLKGYSPRIQQARVALARGEEARFRVAVLARAKKSLLPIAKALRAYNEDPSRKETEKIPFRAVELEKLQDRPEVLDALALARALINPYDRVAWLGLLRAPWCGLSLAELHRVAGDPGEMTRPIPDILAERIDSLGEESRPGVARILQALANASDLRATQPTSAVGTWLQQIRLVLGGDHCVDAAARANLNLLWACLDSLPAGEQDLLGPALDAALDNLTALPDPGATGDCGVQLMTIHKSKGLEFEVVIVPDLQARAGRSKPKLLSWLERGLPPPTGDPFASTLIEDPQEITEFLIAPIQPKGTDRGSAKAWVDRIWCEREGQETRRILYVAATRAREELHLFARSCYKVDRNGELTLTEPSDCLLATAWPAFEPEIRDRFEAWKLAQVQAAHNTETHHHIETLAASAETNLIPFPASTPPSLKPTVLRRLPADYLAAGLAQPAAGSCDGAGPLSVPSFSRPSETHSLSGLASEPWEANLYARHQGGQLSRSLGNAVHALLQHLAHLRAESHWAEAVAALVHFQPRIAAQVRATGIDPVQAKSLAGEALRLALSAADSPDGRWILSPHTDAANEVRWTGLLAGTLHTVQVDRVFRAGLAPQAEGSAAWWIIDYKTANASIRNEDEAAALAELRPLFAPQLEIYAQVLRNLHGADTPTIRAGLYYPRMLLFDWWEM